MVGGELVNIWDLVPFIITGIFIIFYLWLFSHVIHDPVSRFARGYARIHWWDLKKKQKKKLDGALEELGVNLSILDDKQNCMNCSMWGYNLEACGLVREEGGTHCEYWEAVKA